MSDNERLVGLDRIVTLHGDDEDHESAGDDSEGAEDSAEEGTEE
jgi:hypothetical protein